MDKMKPDNIDKLIEASFRNEPLFQLKEDFSDKLMLHLRKRERRRERKLYFCLSLGIAVLLTFGVIMISALVDLKYIKIADGFTPLAVLVGGLVVLFQYLDKRLVKDRMIKQSF